MKTASLKTFPRLTIDLVPGTDLKFVMDLYRAILTDHALVHGHQVEILPVQPVAPEAKP